MLENSNDIEFIVLFRHHLENTVIVQPKYPIATIIPWLPLLTENRINLTKDEFHVDYSLRKVNF